MTNIPGPSIPAYASMSTIDVDQDTDVVVSPVRSTEIGVHIVPASDGNPKQCSVRFRAPSGEVFEIEGDLIDVEHFANALTAAINIENRRVSK